MRGWGAELPTHEQVAEVEGTSGVEHNMQLIALEQEMAGLRTIITSLGTRVDPLATQNAK